MLLSFQGKRSASSTRTTSPNGAAGLETSSTTSSRCSSVSQAVFHQAVHSRADPHSWPQQVRLQACLGVRCSVPRWPRPSPTWATSFRRRTRSRLVRPPPSNRKTGARRNMRRPWPPRRPQRPPRQSSIPCSTATSLPSDNSTRARQIPETEIWACRHRSEQSEMETAGARIRPHLRIQIRRIRPRPIRTTLRRRRRRQRHRRRTTSRHRRSWTQTVVCSGTFCNSCSTIRASATQATSRGRTRRRACSRSSTLPGWPSCGAFRRTTCRWTTTRCRERWDIITE